MTISRVNKSQVKILFLGCPNQKLLTGGIFMARDIKKEKEWAKAKYTRILGDIDKELGDELKEKLKKENKSIAGWITENAKKYLKKK